MCYVLMRCFHEQLDSEILWYMHRKGRRKKKSGSPDRLHTFAVKNCAPLRAPTTRSPRLRIPIDNNDKHWRWRYRINNSTNLADLFIHDIKHSFRYIYLCVCNMRRKAWDRTYLKGLVVSSTCGHRAHLRGLSGTRERDVRCPSSFVDPLWVRQ